MRETRGPRVVVGVDGSVPSLAALRFAVEEARRRGAALHAVRVEPDFEITPSVPIGTAFARAMGAVPRDLDVFAEELRGPVADALTRRAHLPGDVVIVGTRGRGWWQALWFGSASRAVLRAAHCPVIVVPSPVSRIDSCRPRWHYSRWHLPRRDLWRLFETEYPAGCARGEGNRADER